MGGTRFEPQRPRGIGAVYPVARYVLVEADYDSDARDRSHSALHSLYGI